VIDLVRLVGGFEMVHGWIILDKPLELGSTQAVSAVKRNLRAAGYNMKLKGGIKVGHGGTLGPAGQRLAAHCAGRGDQADRADAGCVQGLQLYGEVRGGNLDA
jgi:hypothetical protein